MGRPGRVSLLQKNTEKRPGQRSMKVGRPKTKSARLHAHPPDPQFWGRPKKKQKGKREEKVRRDYTFGGGGQKKTTVGVEAALVGETIPRCGLRQPIGEERELPSRKKRGALQWQEKTATEVRNERRRGRISLAMLGRTEEKPEASSKPTSGGAMGEGAGVE